MAGVIGALLSSTARSHLEDEVGRKMEYVARIAAESVPLDRLLPEMHSLLKPGGAMAVWTAFPWWSPAPLTRDGLFVYVGRDGGVHNFRKQLAAEVRSGSSVLESCS